MIGTYVRTARSSVARKNFCVLLLLFLVVGLGDSLSRFVPLQQNEVRMEMQTCHVMNTNIFLLPRHLAPSFGNLREELVVGDVRVLGLELLADLILEEKIRRRRTLRRIGVLRLRLPLPLALTIFVAPARLALSARGLHLRRGHLGHLAVREHQRCARVGDRGNELGELFSESCTIPHSFCDCSEATDELRVEL